MLTASVAAGTITAFGETIAAVFGKGGAVAAAAKREGDGATPLGVWPVRAALLRPDRTAAPATRLPWRWLRADDGWSDAAADPAYNRPVSHPHGFSAERLWRDDHAYDIVIVLGHNDNPPVAPLGSAIFWHCTQPDRRPTEGCIAVERAILAGWLDLLAPGDSVNVLP
ncbi:L,D-transpeptidase family protein [Sandarakinorhabdus sp. DWP1-3-1]|uniref:L,D-transpeptidase family protein n=1 Tax=Sandarakinorhabdus sp. DWP1-3-1 TaxID=2804627 RepID=UPI003CFB864F